MAKLNYEFKKPSPKFRAKIYRAGRLFATGGATISDNDLTFYPVRPRSLAISPNDKIKLKVKKTKPLVPLSISEIQIEMSSDEIWYFEIQTVA